MNDFLRFVVVDALITVVEAKDHRPCCVRQAALGQAGRAGRRRQQAFASRLEQELNHRPKQIYTDFERRVGRELGIREGEGQAVENPGLKVARYFETRVPLKSTSKTAIRFAYAVSEVYRRLALGEVEQARAQLALLAGAIEQYAIDHDRWDAGWLMAHMPEPNFHLFPKDPPSSSTEHAHCMEPKRVRAAWKHFQEMGKMRELKKKNPTSA